MNPIGALVVVALLLFVILLLLWVGTKVQRLEQAVTALARIVNKPRRRDRAIRKEIAELEEELEQTSRDIANGYLPTEDDFREADAIREKLDRRLRALAGKPRETPPPATPPPNE